MLRKNKVPFDLIIIFFKSLMGVTDHINSQISMKKNLDMRANILVLLCLSLHGHHQVTSVQVSSQCYFVVCLPLFMKIIDKLQFLTASSYSRMLMLTYQVQGILDKIDITLSFEMIYQQIMVLLLKWIIQVISVTLRRAGLNVVMTRKAPQERHY